MQKKRIREAKETPHLIIFKKNYIECEDGWDAVNQIWLKVAVKCTDYFAYILMRFWGDRRFLKSLLNNWPNEISGVHLNFSLVLKSWRVDCERTTDYGTRISCLNLTSLFALFVFLLCRLTSGAFTIYSSMPTLSSNLNEHLYITITNLSALYQPPSCISYNALIFLVIYRM
jgi:hypothetical protein